MPRSNTKRSSRSSIPVSSEEATRARIRALNKNESAKRLNQKLMAEVKGDIEKQTNDDDEWQPPSDGDLEEDDVSKTESEDSDILNPSEASKKARIRKLDDVKKSRSPDLTPLTSTSSSPTKDDLKKKVAEMEAKLQLLTNNAKNNDSVQSQGKDDNQFSDQSSPDKNLIDKESTEGGHHDSLFSSDDNMESPDKGKEKQRAKQEAKSPERDNTAGDGEELIDESDSLAYQLYTANDKDVVELCRKVYCKKKYVNSAFSQSANTTHCIRRLMPGVFKPDAVINCSLTGQKWRAAAKAGGDAHGQLDPLHPRAVQAILDYANKLGKAKLWLPMKLKKAKPVFSQRLTEMKAAIRKGKPL
ncbi:Putative BEN domain-containing protein B1 [Frankliniella fusca]|uniref:BEN domain-containing protein B1 n=1 Tax=Frankliniella fusca TaxID=407009 RepID=A0AAE1HH88_9NEOP|nr:Putative BEN domain-containing protein B1 [Frankliniella fusca]